MKTIKKAVILAGGFGTRFLPITKAIPKEMLPIIDRPVIDYIVDECLESGIEEIYIISNNKKSSLKNYFENNYTLNSHLKKHNKEKDLKILSNLNDLKKIKIFEEDINDLKGDGYALKRIRKYMKNEPFALIYGDDLMYSKNKPVLKQLIEMYEKTNSNIIAVRTVEDKDIHKYGIIEYEKDNKIKNIIEKPSLENAPSNDAGIGRYILSENFFSELDSLEPNEKGEYQAIEVTSRLIRKESAYACKFEGNYYDTGSKLGYIKANIDYALNNEQLHYDILNHITEIVANKKNS